MSQRLGSLLPWLFLAPILVWAALPGHADGDAAIDALKVRVEDGQVLASFRLEHLFDDEYRRRVQSGLPTELIYEFQLRRERRRWWDATLAEGSVQVVAMYSATTDEYLINFKQDGQLVESRVVRDVEAAREAMTRLERFAVFSLPERDPDEDLQLRVRAELGTKTLLAFIPRTVHTDWTTSTHFHPVEGATAPPRTPSIRSAR